MFLPLRLQLTIMQWQQIVKSVVAKNEHNVSYTAKYSKRLPTLANKLPVKMFVMPDQVNISETGRQWNLNI